VKVGRCRRGVRRVGIRATKNEPHPPLQPTPRTTRWVMTGWFFFHAATSSGLSMLRYGFAFGSVVPCTQGSGLIYVYIHLYIHNYICVYVNIYM